MPDRAFHSLLATAPATPRADEGNAASPRRHAMNVVATTARSWGLNVSPSRPAAIVLGAEQPLTVFPGHWQLGVMSRGDRALHLGVAISVVALAFLGATGPWLNSF